MIVEDEHPLSQSIVEFLGAGYTCQQAYTYEGALQKIGAYGYDCVILDIMLPGGSGLQLLQHLKGTQRKEAVIIISARNAIEDRVTGLMTGADDYLVKPFHLSELSARIAAVVRRKTPTGQPVIILGDIHINTEGREVKVNENIIPLTIKEYQLLLYFAANKNRLLTKNNITEHLWGENMDFAGREDFTATHITNLRNKIIAAGGKDCIGPVYGVGFKMQVE